MEGKGRNDWAGKEAHLWSQKVVFRKISVMMGTPISYRLETGDDFVHQN